MGVKALIFLVALMVLISACSMEKTKPVVTTPGEEDSFPDITGKVVEDVTDEDEEVDEEPVEEEEEVEADYTEAEEELPPGTHNIIIKDLKLEPRELTIKKGDIVVWKHEDTWEKDESTRHYLAAHTNEFRSPILFYEDTFEHTFENTGTFTYIDILYKDRGLLRGKIVVE